MTDKKNASLDALFEESNASISKTTVKTPKGKGRPIKHGSRQQFPLYIPDEVYFYLLDNVNLRKRSNRSFSMNDLFLEAIDVWLKKNGSPSIKDITKSD